MDNNIRLKTIKELFSTDEYQIPLYQREFAWNEKHITQLFYDIAGHAAGNNENYYLGILVVHELDKSEHPIYETVDGQQRLTALHLLVNALKHYKEDGFHWYDKANLTFHHRPKSEQTLEKIELNSHDWDEGDNSALINAWNMFKRLVKKLGDGNIDELGDSDISLDDFTACLLENVKIVRAPLPEETNLNHYFEVMNNRGEQLEKHEVLKAKMMNVFKDNPDHDEFRTTFHAIWEACSNMDRYVQYGFKKNVRQKIFGEDWTEFKCGCFEAVNEKYWCERDKESDGLNDKSLGDILNDSATKEDFQNGSIASDSNYHSVINFSNFLLHVLRVSTGQDITLDDNTLLEQFSQRIDDVTFVKKFAYRLLKMRYLFDKFIIKRDTQEDAWSLKELEYYSESESTGYNLTFGDNIHTEKVQKLLAMFHVSTPTLVYKHWLTGVLNYLFRNWKNTKNDFAEEYIDYLESQAKEFVFDRHLANQQKDYFDIIFKDDDEPQRSWGDVDESLMRYGDIRNVLIFNYLDYLIWRDPKNQGKRIKEFEFKFRSSVEHFYPQKPPGDVPNLDETVLHNFGNLCLVSHSKNSSFGNRSPITKADMESGDRPLESLKLFCMMKMIKEHDTNSSNEKSVYGRWGAERVKKHNQKMVKILKRQL